MQTIGKLETTLAEKKTALAAFQAKYKIKLRGEVRLMTSSPLDELHTHERGFF